MHQHFMKAALKEAKKAYKKDEIPVGAVAVKDNKVIARGHNIRESLNDPTGHAEIICLKKAAKKIKDWRLNEVSLYVTLEPCAMCAGAIIHARVKELIFGADDKKYGACGGKIDIISKGVHDHEPKVIAGVLEKECREILQGFFRKIRERKKSIRA